MSMKDKMKRRRANSINLSLAANSNYIKGHPADDIINKFIKDVKKADITSGPLESETILEDDYPIYPGYTYLAGCLYRTIGINPRIFCVIDS